MKLLGILLIVLGVIGLVYGGISYTRRETVLDVGPVEVTSEEKETIPLPPIVGAAALLGGIALVVASGSASRRA